MLEKSVKKNTKIIINNMNIKVKIRKMFLRTFLVYLILMHYDDFFMINFNLYKENEYFDLLDEAGL